ncbi:hypothetical protein Tco_1383324 [Tanacetum coccineum]
MSETEPIPPTSSVTALRIPIIKKGEYDLWSMKMRQYISLERRKLCIIVDTLTQWEPHSMLAAMFSGRYTYSQVVFLIEVEMTNAASHMPSSFKRCFSRPIPSLGMQFSPLTIDSDTFSFTLHIVVACCKKSFRSGGCVVNHKGLSDIKRAVDLDFDHPYTIEKVYGDLLVVHYLFQHIEH